MFSHDYLFSYDSKHRRASACGPSTGACSSRFPSSRQWRNRYPSCRAPPPPPSDCWMHFVVVVWCVVVVYLKRTSELDIAQRSAACMACKRRQGKAREGKRERKERNRSGKCRRTKVQKNQKSESRHAQCDSLDELDVFEQCVQ